MLKYIGLVAAAACLLIGGCTGPRPIAEIGMTTHEGSAVCPRDSFLGFGGGDAPLNVDVKRNQVTNYERLRIFVRPAEAGTLDMTSNVVFNQKTLVDEITRAAQESAPRWGRFNRVQDEGSADIIVQPRITTIVAWGDWSKTEQELANQYKGLEGSALSDIAREGIDILITLSFFDRDGNQIASSEAVGRQVSRKGEMLTKASYEQGSGSDQVQVRNAKVDERRLPQIISLATNGAFVSSFTQLDHQLWGIENDKGQRLALSKSNTVPVGANDLK